MQKVAGLLEAGIKLDGRVAAVEELMNNGKLHFHASQQGIEVNL